MKRVLVTYAGLLCTGMVLGWWLRDALTAIGPPQSQEHSLPLQVQVAPISYTKPAAERLTAVLQPAATAAGAESSDPASFEQLLDEQLFEQAITYYENALRDDSDSQAILKPKLERYLSANLDECTGGAFVELVDLWLNAYYDDIPVLLLLAENQRLCSSPEEAASTLQLAKTYAIQPDLQVRVSNAVRQLITVTDETLSREESWVSLLGFLEFLQAIDLATNVSELRRATLYQLVGESQHSQDLLQALRERDDGSDAQWTAALDLQWSKTAATSSSEELPVQAIALTRQGDHFLVSTGIDDRSRVQLMLDTGASVTILGRASFEQIDSAGFRYRGSRLFNTANGVTQGDVYRISSITLGNSRLGGVEIAVLDYVSATGVDGLLGMNVLRNYRFEIDQDQDVLYLHARQ